jgi:uncharacterized protein YcfJ
MKTALALLLASLAITPTFAQVLRPGAVNGAVLGGIAGAVIGNNSGDLRHNAWRGAAYGAGAGLILGSLADNAHERRVATQVSVPASSRVYVHRRVPSYYSYGYGYYGYPEYYGGSYYSYPVSSSYYADDDYDGADYRGNGLVLGALAGAIIGNNSGGLHHNAWRGAAYGAATGYLLGALAENHVRSRPAIVTNSAATTYSSSAPVETPAPDAGAIRQTPAAPPPAASNMAAANSLFGRK